MLTGAEGDDIIILTASYYSRHLANINTHKDSLEPIAWSVIVVSRYTIVVIVVIQRRFSLLVVDVIAVVCWFLVPSFVIEEVVLYVGIHWQVCEVQQHIQCW